MCNAALVYVRAGLVFGNPMCTGVSGLMRTLELRGVLQLNYWAAIIFNSGKTYAQCIPLMHMCVPHWSLNIYALLWEAHRLACIKL